MHLLLTGSTGKVGQRLVTKLAAEGVHVALQTHASLDLAEMLKRQMEEKGGVAPLLQADLSNVSEIRTLVERADAALGGIDALVHTASVYERIPFEEVDEEAWDRSQAIDLKATFFLVQSVAQRMERGGRIILFSDLFAEDPFADGIHYGAAKAGINSMTKGLAKALPRNILMNTLSLSKLDKEGKYERVVELVWNLLTKESKRGEIIRV